MMIESEDDVLERVSKLLAESKNLPFPVLDDMTKEEFDEMMSIGWEQAKSGQGLPLDEVTFIVKKTIREGKQQN